MIYEEGSTSRPSAIPTMRQFRLFGFGNIITYWDKKMKVEPRVGYPCTRPVQTPKNNHGELCVTFKVSKNLEDSVYFPSQVGVGVLRVGSLLNLSCITYSRFINVSFVSGGKRTNG